MADHAISVRRVAVFGYFFAMAADVADAARRARSGERRGGKVTEHVARPAPRTAPRETRG